MSKFANNISNCDDKDEPCYVADTIRDAIYHMEREGMLEFPDEIKQSINDILAYAGF